MAESDIESFIRKTFQENYERLRFENGHSLSPEFKKTALEQVIIYWRRLRDEVAEKVTQTEVKLNLPSQVTPKNRKFGIDGVVDIIREGNRTIMYDIKTHDPEYIQANMEEYEEQLNIYAHIWRNLREQDLDEAAIITTRFPETIKLLIEGNDDAALTQALANWHPIIKIPFDTSRIEVTVRDFGKTIDAIEEFQFSPAPREILDKVEVKGKTFAMRVCRNCDARFSCSSYNEYIKVSKSRSLAKLRKFFNDYGEETEQNAQIDTGIDETAPTEEIINNL